MAQKGAQRTGRCILWSLASLQVGCAIAVVVIVATQLSDTQVQSWNQLETKSCLLSDNTAQDTNCNFAYAIGSISVAATITVVLVQLITCYMCGVGEILDMVFSAVGAAAWLTAAIMFSNSSAQANGAGVPGTSWRVALVILCWVNLGLFAAMFTVSVVTAFTDMCEGCCGKRNSVYSADKPRLFRHRYQTQTDDLEAVRSGSKLPASTSAGSVSGSRAFDSKYQEVAARYASATSAPAKDEKKMSYFAVAKKKAEGAADQLTKSTSRRK